MKTHTNPGILLLCLALAWNFADTRAEQPSAAIPFSAIGAKATADYQGDALAIAGTPDGARLHCGFQKLEGRATPQGLWLESVASDGGRLYLVAQAVNRDDGADEAAPYLWLGLDWGSPVVRLADSGTVEVAGNLVRFIRPGLTEEYSVSVDGVRQDFVITERPPGEGDLRVELALSGARAEASAYGAKLLLEGSGRTLAYSRLRATDAAGQELAARLEVLSPQRLAVRVADANATYPVRIDPTFSDENWISMGGIAGADSVVYAVTFDTSGNLYIGGYFTAVGNLFANRVARWNGTSWSALGSGMNGTVYALAALDNDLYAGGGFTSAGGWPANRIAKWNGSSWSGLGSGMNGWVYALAVSDTNVYAGGTFNTAGDTPANSIAKWNGESWSALGTGMTGDYPPYVYALAVSGSNLYAGGSFRVAGGITANRIARWDGNSWSSLGSGLNNAVYALAVSETNLYAGGAFTRGVAKWDGSSWSPVVGSMGLGMSNPVKALAMLGDYLVAGGEFSTVDGSIANYIAVWDGNSWSRLDSSGMRHYVYALAVSGKRLYAGGAFTKAGGSAANRIAEWGTNGWSPVGSGMVGNVHALAAIGTNVYAGGTLAMAGTNTAGRIVQWNGNGWSALGSGIGVGYISDAVYALAGGGSNLFAGGVFTTAGGYPANRIARWNGSTWSALGSGMVGRVYALAVLDTNLYAGGEFTSAGGSTANRIARWTGSAWFPLGLGLSSNVYALAASGGNLYVGGEFIRATNTGGTAVTVNRVARWNGSAWFAMGTGMNSNVYALAVLGGDVYAAGAFTSAGGNETSHVARWNGTSWSPVGGGVNNVARALAVCGNDLYVGGEFTAASGNAAGYIAKWDGSGWSALGSGMNAWVYALAVSGCDLFAGGIFTAAGGKVSAYVAQASLIPQRGVIQEIGAGGGSVALDCQGLPGSAYAVERATDVLFTADLTTLLTTNAPTPDGLFRCIDFDPPGSTAFYRLLRQ